MLLPKNMEVSRPASPASSLRFQLRPGRQELRNPSSPRLRRDMRKDHSSV